MRIKVPPYLEFLALGRIPNKMVTHLLFQIIGTIILIVLAQRGQCMMEMKSNRK